MTGARVVWPLTLAAVLVAGCGGGGPSSRESGHDLIVHYGCGACHRIGGVEGADGRVGPSLRSFSQKRSIAGQLPNTPSQVASWIRDPRRFDPQTIMPDLGLSQQEAKEVTRYLYEQ